jgi:GlpG protein
MRQIGTLADERQVQRLGDYLLTQGVRVQVDQSEGGFAIWAIDEDRVSLAREELNRFVENPNDERYLAAEREAGRIRDELIRKEKARRRSIVDVRRQWASPRIRPLTFLLIVVCCALAFATDFGANTDGAVWQGLLIASYEPEGRYIRYYPVFSSGSDIARGQVWRLITPIFLHGGPVHLLMNMMAMQSLGTLIEMRRGPWRLALMVLVIAVVSNLAQYAYSGPNFAGISGVAFGLFGYAWVKSEFDPAAGIAVHPSSVKMMLVFMVICMTGLIGSIGNAAHVAGMIMGILLGYGPVVKRLLQGAR